jgi:glutamyl-tRNA reductase
MKLLALGVDHRSAPTAVREAVAFDDARRVEGLDRLKHDLPGCELVILSTCNRVELYAGASEGGDLPTVDDLAGWLARERHVDPTTLAGHLVAHHDEAVVGHLFRVAASLESLVLGEGQILGQVRDAYRAAVARGTVGPVFHALFQRALRVGKRVREATGLDHGRLSVATVAVDLARNVFDTFADKTVLVIGAGKMADLTLQHLSGLRPGRVLVVNRSLARAQDSARRWAGHALGFDALDEALALADVVVSTTAADRPIVDLDRYARLQRHARGGRLALILDIAVPRDFDPRIGDLDQVLLYNVDDLRAQVDQNLRHRQGQVEPAQRLVEQESDAFCAEMHHHRQAGRLLKQLGDYGDALAAQELERFFAACPDLTDPQRRAAEHLVHRLKNQFLHHPRTALRSAAAPVVDPVTLASGHGLIAAVRHLFGLDAADSAVHGGDPHRPHPHDPS